MAKSKIGGLMLAFAMAGTFLVPQTASAAWPDREIQFIVGFPPGGGTDFLARLVANGLSKQLGQPVVVINKPGADGTIATDTVKEAAPDGYTVNVINTNYEIVPFVHKLIYDPLKSFTPITEFAYSPDLLLVNPTVPANDVQDLVALAKAKPKTLRYGTTGPTGGPSIETGLLMSRTHVDMINVPYTGTAPAMVAMLGNEIQIMWTPLSVAIEEVKSGKIKALAINAPQRSPLLPNVPTLEEANLTGFEIGDTWSGAIVPAATPKDVVAKLHDGIVAVLKQPDVQEAMQKQAFVTVANTPEEFGAMLAKDIPQWPPLLKEFGIIH